MKNIFSFESHCKLISKLHLPSYVNLPHIKLQDTEIPQHPLDTKDESSFRTITVNWFLALGLQDV